MENDPKLETLKIKIQNAVTDMMMRVSIDDSHNYTRKSDGKWLPGVTSVSGIIPKGWLAAWGAKEAVKALGYSDFPEDTAIAVKTLAKIQKGMSVKSFVAMLKQAKGAAFRKSKEALVDGKAGHAWVEEYIKAKIRHEELPALPEESEMLFRPLNQFVNWAEKYVKLWILSEARVADVTKEYAGTLDAMAVMADGQLAIVDAKFASHISPEYSLQTAGYAATFEAYDIKVEQRIIVRLPKTLEIAEWDKKTRTYSMVPNSIEVKVIDTPYEFDRETFYSALPVKKWVNYIEKLERKK